MRPILRCMIINTGASPPAGLNAYFYVDQLNEEDNKL